MTDQNKFLWVIIEARDTSIACFQKALSEQQVILIEKEAVIQTLHKAIEGPENQQRLLAKSLIEKEATIQNQYRALEKIKETQLQLVKNLEEKEAVIQELNVAVAAYRSAFLIFKYFARGMDRIDLIAQPVTHRLRNIFAPLLHASARILCLQPVTHRLRNILAPRLGNLNQHTPRELCLPKYYPRPVHVTKLPKISIVTPSFQQAVFIERTIKSVLDQSYPNLEYHVQDGGSKDGTTEVLKCYADRLAGWESRQDNGQSQALNIAFSRTSGEIMAWLNSDDILFPGSLAYIADYFSRHPEIDVVYGHRILIDENDHQIGRWMLPAHDDDVLSWADYIPQETLFWRRRIWEKAGGKVDESFCFAMDWDLLIRFRDAGARFARLPRFLGAFRIHELQKTSAAISEIGHQEMDRIRQRVLGRTPSRMDVRKAVLPYLLKHVVTDLGWQIRKKWGAAS